MYGGVRRIGKRGETDGGNKTIVITGDEGNNEIDREDEWKETRVFRHPRNETLA